MSNNQMKTTKITAADFSPTQTTIPKSAFAGREDIISVELPETITEIADFAFEQCKNLETVILPKSIKAIGISAFCECSKLQKIVIPEGVTVLQDLCFALCNELKEVTIPSTVKTLRPQVFRECRSLRELELPEGLEIIGVHCFDGCVQLAKLNQPKSLKKIGGYAFFNTPLVLNKDYIPGREIVISHAGMYYIPNPIDTSDVKLDPDINELIEKLAQNTHDIWAVGRIADGWLYGSRRDDRLQETPCLVPYSILSELEKEYDRKTAIEAIKVIIKLGFNISKKN